MFVIKSYIPYFCFILSNYYAFYQASCLVACHLILHRRPETVSELSFQVKLQTILFVENCSDLPRTSKCVLLQSSVQSVKKPVTPNINKYFSLLAVWWMFYSTEGDFLWWNCFLTWLREEASVKWFVNCSFPTCDPWKLWLSFVPSKWSATCSG